tara:strand:- start:164 stop:541 length:378 start_codon:yes stop_codon:yes gene_type:complete
MFGYVASKFINSAIDISDGLFGDLNKILNQRYGAKIIKKSIPISNKLKKILLNNSSLVDLDEILGWGDDYELLFTAKTKYRRQLMSLSKKNNIKLSRIGSIINKIGIFDDSLKLIKNINSFDHFC